MTAKSESSKQENTLPLSMEDCKSIVALATSGKLSQCLDSYLVMEGYKLPGPEIISCRWVRSWTFKRILQFSTATVSSRDPVLGMGLLYKGEKIFERNFKKPVVGVFYGTLTL